MFLLKFQKLNEIELNDVGEKSFGMTLKYYYEIWGPLCFIMLSWLVVPT